MNLTQLFEWPAALLRRLVLSIAAGGLFLFVGLAAAISLEDLTLFALSVLLAFLTFLQCFFLYRLVSQGAFETIDGVCVGVRPLSMRKQQAVRFLPENGAEQTLHVNQHIRLLVGNRYRLYFRTTPGTISIRLPRDLQVGDLFLGLEDLGKDCPQGPNNEVSAEDFPESNEEDRT